MIDRDKLRVGDVLVFESRSTYPSPSTVTAVAARYFETDGGYQWAYDGGTYPKKDRGRWSSVRIKVPREGEIREIRMRERGNAARDTLTRFLKSCTHDEAIALAEGLPVKP
jgi:hypothetical protein